MTAQRRALVTGATGFVGWHVARCLVRNGWNTTVLVRATSRLERLGELRDATTVHVHDGTTESMLRIVRATRPDTVFHVAAVGGAIHGPGDIMPMLEANVVFGTQLLEAMAVEGVGKIVCTGTHWQHYRNEQYNPVCLYAACKEAFESILRYYGEVRGIDAIVLVLSDTYGSGDTRPKLFNLLHHAAHSGVPLDMTPGEQMVDLVHVDDVAEAYCVAAALLDKDKPTLPKAYAVRSGTPIRLRELVALYTEILGVPVPVVWGGRAYRSREVMIPWSGGEVLPGWRPRVGLPEGIKSLLS